MPRYKLTLEYNGGGFCGWQKQPDRPSVQTTLEAAIEKLTETPVEAVCAGRTDAGVHARGQVAHFDCPKDLPDYSIMQAINFHLLPEHRIVVRDAERVPDDFHARFSAKERTYFYRIVNRRARLALDHGLAWFVPESLDAEAMHHAAQLLVGSHDFTSFRDTQCQANSPIRTLDEIRLNREGDEIHMFTRARSFLHHQVRNMIGTLRLVGSGKWSADDLKQALEAKDRAAAGETAPPDGLYFMKVNY